MTGASETSSSSLERCQKLIDQDESGESAGRCESKQKDPFKSREEAKKDQSAKDRAKEESVIRNLKAHLSHRRPAKLETKWHAWKYHDDLKAACSGSGSGGGGHSSGTDSYSSGGGGDTSIEWLNKTGTESGSDLGWGRRIYDKNEIEVSLT